MKWATSIFSDGTVGHLASRAKFTHSVRRQCAVTSWCEFEAASFSQGVARRIFIDGKDPQTSDRRSARKSVTDLKYPALVY